MLLRSGTDTRVGAPPGTSPLQNDYFARERRWGFLTMALAYKGAFDAASAACVRDRDPYQASWLLSLARDARLMQGLSAEFDQAVKGVFDLDAAVARASKCLRFEVAFDSRIDAVTGAVLEYSYVTTRAALVEARYVDGLFRFQPAQGTATERLHYANGSNPDQVYPACDFFLHFLDMDLSNPLSCDDNPRPPPFDVRLAYTPAGDAASGQSTGWWGMFQQGHLAEFQQLEGMSALGLPQMPFFAARDFRRGTGSVFAEKTYSRSAPCPYPNCTLSEQTTITITHVPVQ
jgi:hypothetical protein